MEAGTAGHGEFLESATPRWAYVQPLNRTAGCWDSRDLRAADLGRARTQLWRNQVSACSSRSARSRITLLLVTWSVLAAGHRRVAGVRLGLDQSPLAEDRSSRSFGHAW